MVKLSSITEQGYNRQPNKTTPMQSDLFQQTLARTMAAQTAPPPLISGTGELPELTALSFNTLSDPSSALMQKTGNLLDLLDNYGRSLGNPRKTIADITPLVDQLKENAGQLSDVLGQSPTQDNDISSLAAQCALTANLEVMKFQRGDYN